MSNVTKSLDALEDYLSSIANDLKVVRETDSLWKVYSKRTTRYLATLHVTARDDARRADYEVIEKREDLDID